MFPSGIEYHAFSMPSELSHSTEEDDMVSTECERCQKHTIEAAKTAWRMQGSDEQASNNDNDKQYHWTVGGPEVLVLCKQTPSSPMASQFGCGISTKMKAIDLDATLASVASVSMCAQWRDAV